MKLRRELGLLDVFCIATGAMVSSGIFVLPGLAYGHAGPGVIVSYLIAAALAAVGVLNIAELATAMPRAGGDYFFITRSLGPAMGTIAGLLNWFSLSLKTAFALVGMAAFVRLLAPVDKTLTGVILCGLFVLVNLAGAKHAGRAQVVFVLTLMVLMVGFVILGISHVQIENLSPFTPTGLSGILSTAGFVFVSYGGLIKISGVAGEIRDPGRVIPRAMLLSLLAVSALYASMVWVTVGVLPPEAVDGALTPISDAAGTFLGPWGATTMAVAAILAFISTANAGIMAASRYLFALGADHLMPSPLTRVLRRTGAPFVAILSTGFFIAVALFLPLDVLVEAASLVLLLGFILSCVCVIVLRESRIQNYRPQFRAPFYPVLQGIGILGFLLLVFEMGIEAYLIFAVLFAVGLVIYQLYGSRRLEQDYALLVLMERIFARDLATGSLERELKEIIRERDDLPTDRFDRLVNDAVVLDLEGPMDAETCFQHLAYALSPRLQMDVPTLVECLQKREADSSTAISEFLAIPHVIIPGEKRFEVALVRSRQGIHFSEDCPQVHAVFALLGSRDERNFHLQALAAVAQIVQEKEFPERWLAARSEQGLKDVVLLGHRQRRADPHT